MLHWNCSPSTSGVSSKVSTTSGSCCGAGMGERTLSFSFSSYPEWTEAAGPGPCVLWAEHFMGWRELKLFQLHRLDQNYPGLLVQQKHL